MSEIIEQILKVPKDLQIFYIQAWYAHVASKILAIPREQALMEYTPFYRRVGSKDWNFNPKNREWLSFIDQIKIDADYKDIANIACQINKLVEKHRDEDKEYFGCFRFDIEGDSISIHFRNNDSSGLSPLSSNRIEERLTELHKMFSHVRHKYPDITHVTGGSWLYNFDSYRRLFPSEYTSETKVESPNFPRSNGLWGQILSHNGTIHKERGSLFISKVLLSQCADSLLNSFEFPILHVRSEITHFYKYYDIKS